MFEPLWKNYHRRTRVGIEPATSWLEISSSWLDLEKTYVYTKLQRLSLEHLQPKQKSYNWNEAKNKPWPRNMWYMCWTSTDGVLHPPGCMRVLGCSNRLTTHSAIMEILPTNRGARYYITAGRVPLREEERPGWWKDQLAMWKATIRSMQWGNIHNGPPPPP